MFFRMLFFTNRFHGPAKPLWLTGSGSVLSAFWSLKLEVPQEVDN